MIFIVLAVLVSGTICGSAAAQPALEWTVKKTGWTADDERRFSEFVATLGAAVEARKCKSLNSCLHNKDANPLYYSAVPNALNFYADCADLPYLLRLFFAWRNHLPFSFVDAVKKRADGDKDDLRYTREGNQVGSRRTPLATSAQSPLSIETLKKTIIDQVSSYTFRVLDFPADTKLSDFYSPAINRQTIIPGAILYDPNGHVAVVYKVTNDGRIMFIDAHPDNSLTTATFGKKFLRSRPPQSAGFKRWRPISLEKVQQAANGTITNGTVRIASDAQIPDASFEQFWGNVEPRPQDWQDGKFKIGSDTVDWYDYVRGRLTTGSAKPNPLTEVKNLVGDLCSDFKYRVDAVDLAVKAGIDKKAHPERLPDNIYGTSGEWEEYSTPSRDARIKTSFVELRDRARELMKRHAANPASLDYSGNDLAADMRAAYNQATAACRIQYRNSAGKMVALDYPELQKRLFKLSFDPYHCPELRWGASGNELNSCAASAPKRDWYAEEQRLRNQIDRTYDTKMNFSLDDLRAKKPGSGVDTAPRVDVEMAAGP